MKALSAVMLVIGVVWLFLAVPDLVDHKWSDAGTDAVLAALFIALGLRELGVLR